MLIALLCSSEAFSQSRPVIQTDLPPTVDYELVDPTQHRLEIFDELGIAELPTSSMVDPELRRRDLIHSAIEFSNRDARRTVLGSVVFANLSREDNCNNINESRRAEGEYGEPLDILIEGVRAGALPLDALARDAYVDLADGEYARVAPSRRSSLESLAGNPAVSSWLASAATGVLRFERRLELELSMLSQLEDLCSQPTSGEIRIGGNVDQDVCESHADLRYFEERTSLLTGDMIAFAMSVGPTDLVIECVTLDAYHKRFDARSLDVKNVVIRGLRLQDANLGWFSVKASSGDGRLDLGGSNVDGDVEIEDVALSGPIALQDMDIKGTAFVTRSEGQWLSFERSSLGRVALDSVTIAESLFARYATVRSGITIVATSADRAVYLNDLRSESDVFIDRSRFGSLDALPSVGDPLFTTALSVSSAVVRSIFQIRDTLVVGDFLMIGGDFTSLYAQNMRVHGNANLYNSSFSSGVHLGGPKSGFLVDGNLSLEAIRARTVEVVRGRVGKSLNLRGASASDHMTLAFSIVADEVDSRFSESGDYGVNGLGTPKLLLSETRIAGGLSTSNLLVDELDAEHLAAGFVELNATKRGDDAGFVQDIAAGQCFDASAAPEIPIDATSLSPEHRQSVGLKPAVDDEAYPGCIGTLNLSNARIAGNTKIEGSVGVIADLTASVIEGELILAGSRTRYMGNACVAARGLRVDTVVYDLDPVGAARGPAMADFFGSEFRIVRSSEPMPAGRTSWANVENYVSRFLGTSGERCLPGKGLLPGASLSKGSDYQPFLYDALAAGLERSGDLDQARKVRILKNRHYGSTLVFTDDVGGNLVVALMIAAYWVADVVSGFGYENLRAILWLTALTVIGAVLGWVGEQRIAGVIDPLRHNLWRLWANALYHLRLRARPVKRLPAKRSSRPAGPQGASVYFSIDRSVPSLGLDSAFGTHDRLGPYLSTWFYFQRLMSFLILILMVAGAFNVFQ